MAYFRSKISSLRRACLVASNVKLLSMLNLGGKNCSSIGVDLDMSEFSYNSPVGRKPLTSILYFSLRLSPDDAPIIKLPFFILTDTSTPLS